MLLPRVGEEQPPIEEHHPATIINELLGKETDQKQSLPLFLISADDVQILSSDSASQATFRRWTVKNFGQKDERFCIRLSHPF